MRAHAEPQLDINQDKVSVVIPTYRNGARALRAAKLLSLQSLPCGMECEVIIVDDGSDDGTDTLLATQASGPIRVVSLRSNLGRSAARNAGARAAKGEFILFLDSDCVPADQFLLLQHIEALRRGAVVSLGHVTGPDESFWSKYQNEASKRREIQHGRGIRGAGSSANFAVRNAVFRDSGGFDPAYTHYGFEDRDLLLRVAELGSVCWSPGAVVSHLEVPRIGGIATKMTEAGQYTAVQFSARHPQAYRNLGYSKLDARLHPSLRPFGYLFGPFVQRAAHHLDALLVQSWMPYSVARAIVKTVTGVSFLYGTVRSTSNSVSA